LTAAALRDGELVCIFPEGRLTRDGEIGAFRPGLTRIVTETPVPVIPMAIAGLWGSMFSRRTFLLHTCYRTSAARRGCIVIYGSAQCRKAVQEPAGGVKGTLVSLAQRRIDDGAAVIADGFE